MGLKNKLNKMKSFLFDEEEVEEKRPVKVHKEEKLKRKEIIKEEKPEPQIEDFYFEDVSENIVNDTIEIKSRSVKQEKEFKFMEFDDDDFVVSEKKPEPIIKPIVEEKKTPKVPLYQGSKRKEEVKKFKPSPIISPIYGLLDKEGNRVVSDSSNKESFTNSKDVTFDDVRKKAYGSLDDEIENTLKKLSKKTIEEAERDMEEEEKNLSRTAKKSSEISDDYDDKEDEDMILPNIKFKEIDVDLERSKVNDKKVEVKTTVDYDEDDEDDDTKEQDLFNLIDTMYKKEGAEE